jgi:hypothetical protein
MQDLFDLADTRSGFLTSYQWRRMLVCIDFCNLNKATPKDEYPLSTADMLINNALGHQVIRFLGGNTGYNQIFMAEEDMSKMTFRCPGFIGISIVARRSPVERLVRL